MSCYCNFDMVCWLGVDVVVVIGISSFRTASSFRHIYEGLYVGELTGGSIRWVREWMRVRWLALLYRWQPPPIIHSLHPIDGEYLKYVLHVGLYDRLFGEGSTTGVRPEIGRFFWREISVISAIPSPTRLWIVADWLWGQCWSSLVALFKPEGTLTECWLGRDFRGCWEKVDSRWCRVIVWLRVESGTLYVSPSLPSHTIPHWIVDCGGRILWVLIWGVDWYIGEFGLGELTGSWRCLSDWRLTLV